MLPSTRKKVGLTLALLMGVGLAAAAPVQAAIGFDAASRAATTSTGRTSLSWSHTVGGGADRMLVVGVAIEDASTADANITSVTCNGAALTAVPNSKRSGGGTGIIQTQLFYLLNGGLGAAGAQHGGRHHAGSRGRHLRGRGLHSPASARPRRSRRRRTSTRAEPTRSRPAITSTAANSWIVDVVGSGNSGSFTPSSGQTERWDIAASGMTGATSTKALTAAGATTLGLEPLRRQPAGTLAGALAPSTGGGGADLHADHERQRLRIVTRNPNAASYASGTVVTLTATPGGGLRSSRAGAATSPARPTRRPSR